MHTDPQLEAQLVRNFNRRGLMVGLAVVLIVLAVAGWYWQTTVAMVAIWRTSETFAHGALVFPIFLYLLWRQRAELAVVEVKPFPLALIGLGVLGLGWLVAELASTASPAQFAMVAMMPIAVWAVLGTRVLRLLAFPLAFLFFAVPFGEFLLPTLMSWTADITIAALRLTGIPVYREGLHFVIPSGRWSVVEACSGLRYLIASLMVGCLYAHLTYRSSLRRWVFVGVAILVPIIANWARAYMIVMMGHLSNNELATGVDHLVYGWLFFGVVVLAMFWIGARWREDDLPAPRPADLAGGGKGQATFDPRIGAVAALALIAAFAWKPVAATLAADSGVPVQFAPVDGANGWTALAQPSIEWKPRYQQPSAESAVAYRKGAAEAVIYVAYYRDQSQGSELISSLNELAPTSDRRWLQVAWGSKEVEMAGTRVKAATGEIRGADERFVVWHWYWVNGWMTSSSYVAKAALALSQLAGRGDDSAVIAVYALKENGTLRGDAVLEEFLRDMGSSIERALERTRSGGGA